MSAATGTAPAAWVFKRCSTAARPLVARYSLDPSVQVRDSEALGPKMKAIPVSSKKTALLPIQKRREDGS